MRVRLSYTVEEDDVLEEAAKIVNLSADDMQQAIKLFSTVQQELKGEEDDGVVNIHKCYEMIEEFRNALVNVDTRLQEVTEIVRGFDDYQRHVKSGDTLAEAPPANTEEPVDED